MDTIASALTMTLGRAQFLRVERPAGLCVQVTRGTLWITADGSACDLELAAGERRCFEAAAPLVIGTLGGAAEFSAARRATAGVPTLAWA